jgi:hypothetical protein
VTSTNQTSLILPSLDKALIDNADKMQPGEGDALVFAVCKTIIGTPVPAEPTTSNHNNREGWNEVTVRNR